MSVQQIEQARRVVPIGAVQNRYSLADAGTTTVVDFWEREGIAFVPYYPLSGDDGPRVAAAAKRLGVTGTMVKLAWVLGARPSSFPSRGRSRSSTCARTSRRSSSSWKTRTTSRPEASGGAAHAQRSLHSVISRAPRPRVRKLALQRMSTRSRFWKPTR